MDSRSKINSITNFSSPTITGQLLGQPDSNFPASQISIEATSMDSIVHQTGNLQLTGEQQGASPMTLTENFSSAGNPCLDFFFHVVPRTPPNSLILRLESAWIQDPLTTLKLICNLRGVRGTGKSDKEGFYTSALWLHKNHPKTLALNLRVFADFGYLKDLSEILYRLLEGPEIRIAAKKERKCGKRHNKCSLEKNSVAFKRGILSKPDISEKEKEGLLENLEELEGKEKARAIRKAKEFQKKRKSLDRYQNDFDYRFLYDSVSDVFAELLKLDIGFLNSGDISKISLASKWCPSIDSSYDKATLICEGIARRIFPRDCDKEYEGIEEAHYVYRIRDRLRKQVLVPLHKALDLPEVYMSSNQWSSLPYRRVPLVAMRNYKELFLKHDDERFEDYLEQVQTGKAKIAAGALLPHELVKSLNEEGDNKFTELQWARMVEDFAKKGNLRNCIAVSDVSDSMDDIPMEVSVSLGLLVSELSDDPWKGKVLTFSADPQLHLIEGVSLKSKTESMRRMDWHMNVDFQKVFDRILQVAVKGNLSEDQMIKRVFVFSDMEFDDASRNSSSDSNVEGQEVKRSWEADYEAIAMKFKAKGYNKVPDIVFWNLRHSSSTPVFAKRSGVALVCGFSKNLLTLFLEEGGIVSPEDVMTIAISGNEYNKLVIYD